MVFPITTKSASTSYTNLTNLALDRIVELDHSNEKYRLNDEIDFSEYFYDIVGVSFPEGGEVQEVEIKINKNL